MNYQRSDFYEGMADELILGRPELSALNQATIIYLEADATKESGGKAVYADCEKVKDKYRAISGVDFIITVYADGQMLTEEQQKILIYHELLHADYDSETEARRIRQHDVQDFREIIEAYGLDWAETK